MCSRDEVKTKWSVSDFIKAFIKFHGHVYLSKSVEKLCALREKLEEQFQVQTSSEKCSFIWSSDEKANSDVVELNFVVKER